MVTTVCYYEDLTWSVISLFLTILSLQVVAGLKYIITVKMGKTPCRKNSANEVCAVHSDPALARVMMTADSVFSFFVFGYRLHNV